MEMVLQRQATVNGCTLGDLFVEGAWQCFTCEDPIRQVEGPVKSWKVPGETAIPTGNYKVVITYSTRFKKELPLLLEVEGFSGIRIHPGNGPHDTEGCLLVGRRKDDHGVEESRAAFMDLYLLIEEAIRAGETVTIEVKNP